MRHVGNLPREIRGWLAERQLQVSDQIHMPGDLFAANHGWRITHAPGRLGLEGREYRDPRFDQCRKPSPAPAPATAGEHRIRSTTDIELGA